MADDLFDDGVSVIAVSPGFMRLDRMNLTPECAAMTESPEFAGRAVALATDLNAIELAREYGFRDVDGSQISPFWIEHDKGPTPLDRA